MFKGIFILIFIVNFIAENVMQKVHSSFGKHRRSQNQRLVCAGKSHNLIKY